MRILFILAVLMAGLHAIATAVEVSAGTTIAINDVVPEDYAVSGTLKVRGILTGHITVRPGATVHITGTVNGPIDVTEKGTLIIEGTLNGALRGDGHIRVAGIVVGNVTAAHLSQERGSIINGVKKP